MLADNPLDKKQWKVFGIQAGEASETSENVTNNYCVNIRVYANSVQKFREYLISLCHGD